MKFLSRFILLPFAVNTQIPPPAAAQERSMPVSVHAAPPCADTGHAYRLRGAHHVPGCSRHGHVHSCFTGAIHLPRWTSMPLPILHFLLKPYASPHRSEEPSWAIQSGAILCLPRRHPPLAVMAPSVIGALTGPAGPSTLFSHDADAPCPHHAVRRCGRSEASHGVAVI
jgi:hypothetical protein